MRVELNGQIPAPITAPLNWNRHDPDAEERAVRLSVQRVNAVFDSFPPGSNETALDLALGEACPFSHAADKAIWLYVIARVAWARGWRWRGLAERIESYNLQEARD